MKGRADRKKASGEHRKPLDLRSNSSIATDMFIVGKENKLLVSLDFF